MVFASILSAAVREYLQEVLKAMDEAARLTIGNTTMTLNIAFNYGARGEIVDAVKSIVSKAHEGKIKADDIDEKTNQLPFIY